MSQVTWTDVVTAGTAVLALMVAGLSLYLRQRDNRPSLRIVGSMGFMPEMPMMMAFSVTNNGRVDATIANILLVFDDGREMALPGLQGERDIPCRIAPGEVVRFWNPFSGVQGEARKAGYSGFVNVAAAVVDGLGNRYEDEPRKFRVNGANDS